MNRPARLRLTACLSLTAATATVGVLLAPAAHAEDEPSTQLPGRVADSNGTAQSRMAAVPPFGRKWG